MNWLFIIGFLYFLGYGLPILSWIIGLPERISVLLNESNLTSFLIFDVLDMLRYGSIGTAIGISYFRILRNHKNGNAHWKKRHYAILIYVMLDVFDRFIKILTPYLPPRYYRYGYIQATREWFGWLIGHF